MRLAATCFSSTSIASNQRSSSFLLTSIRVRAKLHFTYGFDRVATAGESYLKKHYRWTVFDVSTNRIVLRYYFESSKALET
jgi:hypothetical protein